MEDVQDLQAQVTALKQRLHGLAKTANRHLMEPDGDTTAVLARQVRRAYDTLGLAVTDDLLDRGETR